MIHGNWCLNYFLQELKVGTSEKTIFEVYHPDAMDVYNVCSVLSKVQELKPKASKVLIQSE